MAQYESKVVLGAKYRDKQTGLEGVATVISFHQHACERVVLEASQDGDLKLWEFDAERLVCLEPEKAQPAPVPTGATVGPVRRTGRRQS